MDIRKLCLIVCFVAGVLLLMGCVGPGPGHVSGSVSYGVGYYHDFYDPYPCWGCGGGPPAPGKPGKPGKPGGPNPPTIKPPSIKPPISRPPGGVGRPQPRGGRRR